MGAQHALQLAHGALGVQPLIDRGAQRDRRGKAHDRAAAVEQHRQQATETTHQGPVFREQHREPAALLVRRAADEDRHRHQVHVQLATGAVRLQDLGQRVRVGLGATLLGDQRVAAAPARQGQVGALAPGRVTGDRHQRRGQAGFAAGLVQDQRIGQTVVLQHVDHRAAVVVLAGLFGFDLQRQPRLDQAAEQARPPRRAATGRTRAGHDRGRHDGGRLRIDRNGLHGRASGRWNRGGSTVGRHGSGRRGRSVRRLGRLFAGERQGILVRHRLHYGLAGAEAPSLTIAAASASAAWRASCSACAASAACSSASVSSSVRVTYQCPSRRVIRT